MHRLCSVRKNHKTKSEILVISYHEFFFLSCSFGHSFGNIVNKRSENMRFVCLNQCLNGQLPELNRCLVPLVALSLSYLALHVIYGYTSSFLWKFTMIVHISANISIVHVPFFSFLFFAFFFSFLLIQFFFLLLFLLPLLVFSFAYCIHIFITEIRRKKSIFFLVDFYLFSHQGDEETTSNTESD